MENMKKVAIEKKQKVVTQHLSGTLLVQQPRKAIMIALSPDIKMNMWIYELKYTS